MTLAPAPGTTPGPLDPHRAHELLLAKIAADGTGAAALALLAAGRGEPTAAALQAGELVRALPEVGWWTAHDVLGFARIPARTPLGELTPSQRGALAIALRHCCGHNRPADDA